MNGAVPEWELVHFEHYDDLVDNSSIEPKKRNIKQKMKSNESYQRKGLIFGAILGLGAPIGSLLLRMFFIQDFRLNWLINELEERSFYYGYMTLTTPVVFAAFGYGLGTLLDQVSVQKQNLEILNVVLKGQSITDDMTGLYNHRHIVETLDKEIERAKRHNRPLSCMMIDVDDFKKINDDYGHLVGDAVLREVAFLIKNNIRKIDFVGRYGGDEFFVILPESMHTPSQMVSEKIQKAISDFQFDKPNHFLHITVSIGLWAVNGLDHPDRNGLIEKADQALRRAKHERQNKLYSSPETSLIC